MLFDNFISIFFSFKIKQVCHNRKTIPNVCLQQGYRSHADKCGSPFKSIPENLWQFFFIITFGFFLSFWNILNQLNEQAMKIEKTIESEWGIGICTFIFTCIQFVLSITVRMFSWKIFLSISFCLQHMVLASICWKVLTQRIS